ncbi:hypothetical protein ACIHCQ_00990 [Streptomyces sp. NPDC052236]|uniref:hypothetical protein n=1 Tax=Streptomyces sp. NPDC052236 TaxID=3365686 RepID=UPI0037D6B22E
MATLNLTGVTGGLRNFSAGLGQSTTAVRSTATAVDRAAKGVTAAGRDTDQSAREVGRLKAGLSGGGQGVAALRRGASGAAGPIGRLRTGAKDGTRELRAIKREADSAARSASTNAKGSTLIGRFSGLLGGGAKSGATVMKVINVAMKASPIGLIVGLLAPIAAQIIEMAMNSKAGQKVINVVFGLVSMYFELAAKIVLPIVTAYLTVVVTVFTTLGNILKDPVGWVRTALPKAFDKVRDAMRGTLTGIGDLLRSAFQTVLGVIQGPVNAVIAFANWVIDGLNSLSFNILGKKFGVDLDKIPTLADGGIVVPGREHPAVIPLERLDRMLGRSRYRSPPRSLAHFHERPGRGAHGTAEDLRFLSATHT